MVRKFDASVLSAVELFCLSVETESFTAAANLAGITPAAVSRAIARLEERLGARLFVRTTRRVRLTDAGRIYHEHCSAALAHLVDAEREVGGQQQVAKGRVRLSVPTPIAHCILFPALPRFNALFPGVSLDIHVSNRSIDFTSEGYDLAIRGRAQPDSSLVVRPMIDAELVVVATPEYLQRVGTPDALDDLQHHECVQFILPSTGQAIAWQFRDRNRDVDVETRGSTACLEDFMATASLARAGVGLVQTYRFMVKQDLADGRLCEVLMRYGGRSRPFSLLYPTARHMPARVRAAIEFLLAELPRALL